MSRLFGYAALIVESAAAAAAGFDILLLIFFKNMKLCDYISFKFILSQLL